MTINYKGRTFYFQVLPNGLLSAYDYGPKWQLTFKMVGGCWTAHNSNADAPGYTGLIQKLNER